MVWYKIYEPKGYGAGKCGVRKGFNSCKMVQQEIKDMIMEGCNPDEIQVFTDEPGSLAVDVTQWQVSQALKKLGKKYTEKSKKYKPA